MLPGDFDASAAVRQLTPYAVVGGTRREVESVALDRELSHDLPEQVGGANGIGKASGTIVWTPQDVEVQDRPVSPWRKSVGWPPHPGTRVRVYVTDGTTSYPRFSGVIDYNTGDPNEPGFTSKIIDDRDRLNRQGSMIALLRHMVPHGDTPPWRSIGLDHFYVLTTLLRQARLYNTPPAVGDVAVSVPLQGSVWPETGDLTQAYGPTQGQHGWFRRSAWGYAAEGFNAWYNPRVAHSITVPTQISFQLSDTHAGTFYVDVRYTTGQRIRVRGWDGERRVTAQYYDGSTWSSVASLSHAQMEAANTVSLLVKNGVWELRNNTHDTATAAQSVSGGRIEEIYLHASQDAALSSVAVLRPSTVQEHRSLSFTPATTFKHGTLVTSMDMSPRVENENIAAMIEEICKATLTAAWWDETGVLRFEASDVLRSRRPVQTLTTLDDITRVQWEDSIRSERRAVKVTWEDASISKGSTFRKELFRGSRDSLLSNDTIEVFAAPANDKEWFAADLNPRRLTDADWSAYSLSKGSMVGVYYVDAEGNELPTSRYTTTIRTERLGQVALKIVHTAGSYAGGVEATLGVSEHAAGVRESHRGDPLPVIRGKGEGTWVDQTTTSEALGPEHAPELTHDLGRWGHRYGVGSAAQRLADWLMGQLATPKPRLTNVEVLYDPRRQLGDVYTIEAPILGVRLEVIATGLRETLTHAEATQSLDVRLVNASPTGGITYDELAQAWAGHDYAAMQAVWANMTYHDFEAAPLEGAPEA